MGGGGGAHSANRLRNSTSSRPRGLGRAPDEAQDSLRESDGENAEFRRGRMYQSQLQSRQQKQISKQEIEGRGANASQAGSVLLFWNLI